MDDLISRQAAIDAIRASTKKYTGFMEMEMYTDDDAIEAIINLPSAQPSVPDTDVGDTISRQAAIDIERNATVDTNPSHFEAHQKFTQYMDDAEISSFGRWQWSNGFNTALTAVGIDLKKLPSAQPEQQWIPVTERLPEPNEEDELGFIKAYLVQDGRWMDVARWNGGFWVAWGYGTVLKDVTAWMPLPEPYRERGEA